MMGLALAFFYSWLIIIAAVALLITIGGLLFEYYVGQNAQPELTPHALTEGPSRAAEGPSAVRAVRPARRCAVAAPVTSARALRGADLVALGSVRPLAASLGIADLQQPRSTPERPSRGWPLAADGL